jgi:hypothetical protein
MMTKGAMGSNSDVSVALGSVHENRMATMLRDGALNYRVWESVVVPTFSATEILSHQERPILEKGIKINSITACSDFPREPGAHVGLHIDGLSNMELEKYLEKNPPTLMKFTMKERPAVYLAYEEKDHILVTEAKRRGITTMSAFVLGVTTIMPELKIDLTHKKVGDKERVTISAQIRTEGGLHKAPEVRKKSEVLAEIPADYALHAKSTILLRGGTVY